MHNSFHVLLLPEFLSTIKLRDLENDFNFMYNLTKVTTPQSVQF
jgi:hypothetical protein